MVGKLLLFMVSFFGIMAVGPGLAVLAIWLFKVDFEKLLANHGMVLSIGFALYVALVGMAYFSLQDRILVFRPEPGTAVLPKEEVMVLLEKSFTAPTVEGSKLFDYMAKDDKVVVTWASSLTYFQVTNVGGRGMKRVMVLTLDGDRHNAYFLMKDKDWRWNLSKNFFSASLSYSTGIFSEFDTEAYPSIVFSKTGGLSIDIKKLKYNSNDLWNPIQAAFLSSGWTLRGGMLPKIYQRVLFCALPLGLLVFGFCGLVTGAFKGSPKAYAPGQSATTASAPWKPAGPPPPTTASPEERAMYYMTTENLEAWLNASMMTPSSQMNDYIKKAFTTYAKGYLQRPDKKEKFAGKLRKYAEKNGFEGVN